MFPLRFLWINCSPSLPCQLVASVGAFPTVGLLLTKEPTVTKPLTVAAPASIYGWLGFRLWPPAPRRTAVRTGANSGPSWAYGFSLLGARPGCLLVQRRHEVGVPFEAQAAGGAASVRTAAAGASGLRLWGGPEYSIYHIILIVYYAACQKSATSGTPFTPKTMVSISHVFNKLRPTQFAKNPARPGFRVPAALEALP